MTPNVYTVGIKNLPVSVPLCYTLLRYTVDKRVIFFIPFHPFRSRTMSDNCARVSESTVVLSTGIAMVA